ncbi:MAG: 50S ribosomal protein L3 [Deltaproteobacteria bacterium]|jgi:large subunit ribosomal protein L3|nr:50S ribosomal protein L3 [Deltaproteobacteria bacterium]
MAIRVLGTKLGMSQVFSETGERIPVTLVEAGPLTVVQVKTASKDGYDALQLGYGQRKTSFKSKPLQGHFKKAGVRPTRALRETRVTADEAGQYKPGDRITVDQVFSKGDRIDVMGTSKGRGFAGVMKRHNFRGKNATHGTHEAKRHGGSIGMHTEPGKVWKGQGMAGHYGAERVTVLDLEVVDVRPDENLLLIRGGVPGAPRSLVSIRTSVKSKKKAAKAG